MPLALIEAHGAVSDPVVRVMAESVRERFAADFGLATTGISGPGGGTAEKPVGLVHVALARAEGTHSEHFVFPLDRTRHRLLTTQVALDWVRRAALGVELVGEGGGGATHAISIPISVKVGLQRVRTDSA